MIISKNFEYSIWLPICVILGCGIMGIAQYKLLDFYDHLYESTQNQHSIYYYSVPMTPQKSDVSDGQIQLSQFNDVNQFTNMTYFLLKMITKNL